MRKIIFYLLLLISTVSFGQTTIANKLKITAAIKDNLASRVMVQDSLTGELKWVLKNSLGTVKSVTGTSGVTVALGTSTPVIGLGAITPTSTNGVSATTMAYNDATSSIQTQLNGKQPVGTYATGTGSATGTNTGDNAVNTLYSGLVTNATHTGDATGATALTVKGINGTLLSGLATGILKNTTTTGVPSIAVAADFPTLNQNTTGTAAGLSSNITESQVTNLVSDLSGKAPSTGGTGYIQNQNASAQTANMWISGSSRFDGNVGIGTTAPSYILDLLSSNPRLRVKDSSTGYSVLDLEGGSGSFYIANDNSTGSSFGGAAYAGTLYRAGAYPISMWTNATERMRITSGGNVLIGTTIDSGNKLRVNGTVRLDNLSGTGTRTVVADASGNLSAGYINGWTDYTPTISLTTNLTSVGITTGGFRYKVDGNIVTVTGNISANITTANTAASYTITFPVNRALTTSTNIGIVSAAHTDGTGRVSAGVSVSAATNGTSVYFYPITTGNNTQTINLNYDITK